MKQGVCSAASMIVSMVLAGCASSPFYNEARDLQGQKLVEVAGKVDLGEVVDELDLRFAALRALELETLQARAATQRDMEIAMVASAGPGGNGTLATRYVGPLLDARIERLVGRPLDAAALDAVLTGVVDDEHADAQVASALRTFNSTAQLGLADCAGARAAVDETGKLRGDVQVQIPVARRGPAQLMMTNLLARCKVAAGVQPAAGDAGGELQRLAGLQARADGELQAYRQALGQHRQSLQVATAEYQMALDTTTPRSGDATASARLASAAGLLASSLGALREAARLSPDAFGHAVALERLSSLDSVVGVLASGSTDLSQLSAENKRAVGLVRLMPGIADDADALLTAARKPRLAPMLLALEQQRLVVQGFNDRAALQERRAALRLQQLEAARSELWALARARRALGPPPQGVIGATVDLTRSLDDALADSGEGNRRRAVLYESLALYFDHALYHRGRTAALEMAFNGTTDEQVMMQSRSAAAQWSSLMKNMAAVLAEHHAAGIKPADLAEFLKGFGLVLIGSQVGK